MSDFSLLIKNNRTYFTVLFFSFLFFIRKGIQYVLLESYMPLLIITLVLILIFYSIYFKKKIKLTLRFWSALLVVWAAIRLLLFLANALLKELSESHIYFQLFSLGGAITSIVILAIGLFLFINNREFL